MAAVVAAATAAAANKSNSNGPSPTQQLQMGQHKASYSSLNSLNSKSNPNFNSGDLISNETIDGTVAIAASMNTLYNGNALDLASRLDGRIIYQRNGNNFLDL